MKFLIDENLPPHLAVMIREKGFEAKHINDFGNELPISDNAIRRLALRKSWVVVTRDDDFVKSYVSRHIPEKLIYVFGFTDRMEILQAFRDHWDQIPDLIREGELIEVNPSGVKLHF